MYHQKEQRIHTSRFVAYLAYCLQVTSKGRLRQSAGGLTSRKALDKFASIPMMNVVFPTQVAGQELVFQRDNQPRRDYLMLLEQLQWEWPGQALPPSPAWANARTYRLPTQPSAVLKTSRTPSSPNQPLPQLPTSRCESPDNSLSFLSNFAADNCAKMDCLLPGVPVIFLICTVAQQAAVHTTGTAEISGRSWRQLTAAIRRFAARPTQ